MKRLALVLTLLLGAAPVFAADEAGKADTSTGAKEQSSAPQDPLPKPPTSHSRPAGGERSSAPEGSSAANPSKPNPALGGSDSSKE